ncbi:MAG: hypothetical protein LBT83_02990 [Tannerella sp.]|nr:hypothetical protein [Tannerella sp.]
MKKISILLVLLLAGITTYGQDYREEADKCLAIVPCGTVNSEFSVLMLFLTSNQHWTLE